MKAHPAVMQTMIRELVAPAPATRAVLLAGLAPLVNEATTLLARGQSLGEVRTDRRAAALAGALLGHLTMAYVQQWLRPAPDWASIPHNITAFFLEGAAPRVDQKSRS